MKDPPERLLLRDPEKAARRILEIANSIEDQRGHVDVGKIIRQFMFRGGRPAEYIAGMKLAAERGWLLMRKAGKYVKFTQAGRNCGSPFLKLRDFSVFGLPSCFLCGGFNCAFFGSALRFLLRHCGRYLAHCHWCVF